MYNWPAELVLWMAYLSYLSIQLLYPGMLSCLSSNDTTFLWLFQTFCRHHPLNASIPNGSTHGPLFSDTGHLPSVDWSHSQIPLTCLRRTLLNVFLRLDLFPELYQDVHRWPKLNVLKPEFIFSPDPALPLSLSLFLSVDGTPLTRGSVQAHSLDFSPSLTCAHRASHHILEVTRSSWPNLPPTFPLPCLLTAGHIPSTSTRRESYLIGSHLYWPPSGPLPPSENLSNKQIWCDTESLTRLLEVLDRTRLQITPGPSESDPCFLCINASSVPYNQAGQAVGFTSLHRPIHSSVCWITSAPFLDDSCLSLTILNETKMFSLSLLLLVLELFCLYTLRNSLLCRVLQRSLRWGKYRQKGFVLRPKQPSKTKCPVFICKQWFWAHWCKDPSHTG